MEDELKEIWYTSSKQEAMRRSNKIYKKYKDKYPKAMIRLKYGIHDTLTFLDFPEYSPKKISTSNVLERLNKEFRRRSKSIGVFPNVQACLRLFSLYAIKYADSWEESWQKSRPSRRLSKQIHLHYRDSLLKEADKAIDASDDMKRAFGIDLSDITPAWHSPVHQP